MLVQRFSAPLSSIRLHMMTKQEITPQHLSAVAREAKALVALAFRNGPIEGVHA
jgi:hypothetical protein